MSDPGDRGADLYHSDFGEVTGGAANLEYKGTDLDHITVQYGKDARFSFNVDINTGDISGVHGRFQAPDRPW
jgi:hypothetical protein